MDFKKAARDVRAVADNWEGKDEEDILAIAKLLEHGDWFKAKNAICNLDTAVRDDIPQWVYIHLGCGKVIPRNAIVDRPLIEEKKPMNVQEVIEFIDKCNDTEILRELSTAIREAYDRKTRLASRGFRPGDRVKFTTTKGSSWGTTLEGVVERVNPKTIKVRVMQNGRLVMWRVGPSLLTKIA